MKKLAVCPCLLLLALLNNVVVSLPQAKKSQEKVQPAVTIEMMRKLNLEIEEKVRAARERGNKLTELNALRALEPEYVRKGIAARMTLATRILTLAPELGNYREALRNGDVGHDLQTVHIPSTPAMLAGFRPRRASTELVRAAAAHQVVMINEAHHVPQHRAFTISLLKDLRKIGFTHLATETLYESDSSLNERGYPTVATGYYTQEPVYGDLIRTALKLGYRVVAYEPTVARTPDEREVGQARNLVNRILKDNPGAKMLVHAGYSHIEESGSLVGAVTMAQRFKEMSGIDPLTIDQTKMTEHSALRFEMTLYRHVTGRKEVRQPTIYQNREGKLWSLDRAKWDVTLFHPRSRYENGRPNWLRLIGVRKPYALPSGVCGKAETCLIAARYVNESKDAVPIDQVEVVRGRRAPALMLPEGEFAVKVEDALGRFIRTMQVHRSKH